MADTGRQVEVFDIAGLAGRGGSGAVWSLETEDLDVNLVRFEAGAGVGAHVNREVDVLLVVVAGEGVLISGGAEHRLRPGQAAMIPKGVERSIRAAAAGGLAYLTVHRRRQRLWPSVKRANPS